MDCIENQIPSESIMRDDAKLIRIWDMLLDKKLPRTTTTSVEHISAVAAPANTIKALPDWAESNNVDICVLSPISATNTLKKVEINIEKNPLKTFLGIISLSLSLFISGGFIVDKWFSWFWICSTFLYYETFILYYILV